MERAHTACRTWEETCQSGLRTITRWIREVNKGATPVAVWARVPVSCAVAAGPATISTFGLQGVAKESQIKDTSPSAFVVPGSIELAVVGLRQVMSCAAGSTTSTLIWIAQVSRAVLTTQPRFSATLTGAQRSYNPIDLKKEN